MSTATSVYPWQQEVWAYLQGYLEQQRIPQALLISGPSGIGKRHLANAFAASLMCRMPLVDHSACGHCQSCTLLAAQTHTDLLVVEPDEPGKAIGIDKIRQLIVKLALKPQFETSRVVIITPADQMNTASANAFLKCLEEPTERTCLILLTEKPSRLPATIRSRCQSVQCPPPDRKIAVTWLQQQGAREDADLLLSLSLRAPLVAKAYSEQGLIGVRKAYFDVWVQLADGKQNIVAIAEQWQKAESLDLATLYRWMSSWVADTIKIAHGADTGSLQNPDFKKSLQALAERLELTGLYRFYDDLLMAQAQLGTQINKQLMLEQILINWSQLNIR
ncbi:MAG: DNA polymerase III subunit delta' [Methylomonas sp.]|nr:DNA polymerase III subunit delta' [Methylomonas sp.]